MRFMPTRTRWDSQRLPPPPPPQPDLPVGPADKPALSA